jgi:hypothetical protein
LDDRCAACMGWDIALGGVRGRHACIVRLCVLCAHVRCRLILLASVLWCIRWLERCASGWVGRHGRVMLLVWFVVLGLCVLLLLLMHVLRCCGRRLMRVHAATIRVRGHVWCKWTVLVLLAGLHQRGLGVSRKCIVAVAVVG